jgi:hypothetical protein
MKRPGAIRPGLYMRTHSDWGWARYFVFAAFLLKAASTSPFAMRGRFADITN